MDSTQDKQTDAAGRASELRQQVLKALAKHGVYDGKTSLYFQREVNDFADTVQALIDSATRTAVTEALDKLIEQSETVQSWPDADDIEFEAVPVRDIESVRAVIAAGGKASWTTANCLKP